MEETVRDVTVTGGQISTQGETRASGAQSGYCHGELGLELKLGLELSLGLELELELELGVLTVSGDTSLFGYCHGVLEFGFGLELELGLELGLRVLRDTSMSRYYDGEKSLQLV